MVNLLIDGQKQVQGNVFSETRIGAELAAVEEKFVALADGRELPFSVFRPESHDGIF